MPLYRALAALVAVVVVCSIVPRVLVNQRLVIIERVMNIKRYIVIGLCLALALSITVFAEIDPDAYWYPMQDGSYGYDQEAYEHDLAVDMVQTSGIDLDPELYWAVDPNSTVAELYYYDFDAGGF